MTFNYGDRGGSRNLKAFKFCVLFKNKLRFTKQNIKTKLLFLFWLHSAAYCSYHYLWADHMSKTPFRLDDFGNCISYTHHKTSFNLLTTINPESLSLVLFFFYFSFFPVHIFFNLLNQNCWWKSFKLRKSHCSRTSPLHISVSEIST